MRSLAVLTVMVLAGPVLAQTPPAAPPAAADADIGLMVEILRANGCEMAVMDIINADPADSLTLDRGRDLRPMVTLQIRAGNLAVDAEGSRLSLPEAVCAGGPLTPTARDDLRAILFANACDLPRAEAEARMVASGHALDLAAFALFAMEQEGEVHERIGVAVTVDGQTTPPEPTALVLNDPACPAIEVPPALDPAVVRTRLIEMLADHGCDMTIGEAQGVMADYGLDIGQIVPVVGQMIGAGEAVEDNGLLTLAPAVCTPSDG